jgi:type VI secretion system ImpM family protein
VPGPVSTSTTWAWAASGKHPVVKDFIRLGPETPAVGALSRWVEKGYSKVPVITNMHSWRFFARGTQSQELVCGLLRDSRDGAGRPFPFLIVGTGRIEGWEKHWVYLPEILGGLWERLEFLSIKRVFDLEELKADVSRLPSPVFKKEWQPETVPEGDRSLLETKEGMFVIRLKGAGDHTSEIVQGLMTLKIHSGYVPDAVFIGGPLEQSFLVAFTRQINAADFFVLWTMGM